MNSALVVAHTDVVIGGACQVQNWQLPRRSSVRLLLPVLVPQDIVVVCDVGVGVPLLSCVPGPSWLIQGLKILSKVGEPSVKFPELIHSGADLSGLWKDPFGTDATVEGLQSRAVV